MADEDDAHEVISFALHPLSARPDGADGIDFKTRIAFFQNVFVARGGERGGVHGGIEENFEPEAIVVGDGNQAVVEAEAIAGAGKMEVIDGVELGEQVVAERWIIAKKAAEGKDVLAGDDQDRKSVV